MTHAFANMLSAPREVDGNYLLASLVEYGGKGAHRKRQLRVHPDISTTYLSTKRIKKDPV